MSAPPPPAHDPQIECILLQTVPWEARKKGGSLLQDCIRDLWEKAVQIGFNYGEENLARVREEGFHEGKIAGFTEGVASERSQKAPESTEAAERHKKALEVERVWGYDVGWKLCSELQASGQKASLTSSTTPSRSSCVAATQTDPVAIPLLNWAEDAAVLPIVPPPVHHLSQPSFPCNFLALSMGITKPFTSLQHGRCRSSRLYITPQSGSSHPISTRRQNNRGYSVKPQHSWYSPPPSFSIFSSSIPSGRLPAQLDWDRDPRLRELGRALAALGWVRP
ncbi:hypothetical protein MVEN_00892200 [Mycena venus]|uniref:Uncharacterized protein n=1 Tax=Mycena venus TaxID=2733690 RepID=A0A8H7D1D1_9AGAR|nr:hypothetical protein MVEN_00892200 [Mycena venus]